MNYESMQEINLKKVLCIWILIVTAVQVMCLLILKITKILNILFLNYFDFNKFLSQSIITFFVTPIEIFLKFSMFDIFAN